MAAPPLFLWAGAELNRRYTAFQSVALPTELPARELLRISNIEDLTSQGGIKKTL